MDPLPAVLIIMAIFLFVLVLILLSWNPVKIREPIGVIPPDQLPTLEQRVEALELCQVELRDCTEVMNYVIEGIKTFQANPIDQWQSIAEQGIIRDRGLYWFVIDQQGVEFVQGAIPNYQPTNLINLQDESGRLIVQDILATSNAGGGWVRYYWFIDIADGVPIEGFDPGVEVADSLVQLKYAYVVPFEYQGNIYTIGTGQYLFQELAQFDRQCQTQTALDLCPLELVEQCERVAQRVTTVVNLFREFGRERALEIMNESRDRFTNPEFFIYANDFTGTVIYNSLRPEQEGENVGDDPCFQAALQNILRCGGGWNRCEFNGVVSQGFDLEATDCTRCPFTQRVIIGSSFRVPDEARKVIS